MAIDRRPFTETACIADYERRLTAPVKRLMASEPNIERRWCICRWIFEHLSRESFIVLSFSTISAGGQGKYTLEPRRTLTAPVMA